MERTADYEIAIKAEAKAHAEFFGYSDEESIALRERVNRANVAVGYVDYLHEFLPSKTGGAA